MKRQNYIYCREGLVWVFQKSLQCSEMQEEIVQGSCGVSNTGGLKKLWSVSLKNVGCATS